MLHSNRIGQGLPITTIIIAVIGLIVLVVLIVLVQTQVSKTSKGIRNVTENRCEPPNEKKIIGTDCDIIYATFTDLGPGEICCRKGTAK